MRKFSILLLTRIEFYLFKKKINKNYLFSFLFDNTLSLNKIALFRCSLVSVLYSYFYFFKWRFASTRLKKECLLAFLFFWNRKEDLYSGFFACYLLSFEGNFKNVLLKIDDVDWVAWVNILVCLPFQLDGIW